MLIALADDCGAQAIPNFLTPQQGDELLDLIKHMKSFPSNANDAQVLIVLSYKYIYIYY